MSMIRSKTKTASRQCCYYLLVSVFTINFAHPAFSQSVSTKSLKDNLSLTSETTADGKISRGTFKVFENRKASAGRLLELDVVVIHANSDPAKPDPVFVLMGGPGLAAANQWRGYEDSWMRKQRDIVLVSQRGTGGSNRMGLPSPNKKSGPQQYLEPLFDPETIQYSIDKLSERADLRMYSTPTAMDDLNDARQALGYDKINIIGGSYGTRAGLVYLRRHGDTVRTATLNGVAPIAFTNPLYHAQSAQKALELIFDRVESNETYRKAFPDLRKKFTEILKRFDNGPLDIKFTSQNGEEIEVKLSREAFATALRFQMYYMNTSRMVPLQIERAYQGDYGPFIENSLSRNRSLGNAVAMGMLLCVTAAEDVARIDPDTIDELTRNTFLGDRRVRRQMAVCAKWPKSELPEDFGEPVKSDVPTLILSGTIDPVTPPEWGELVHKNFPNSVHVVAPAAHGVGGACIGQIQRDFLERGSVQGLDVSCVEKMKLPPLYLPKEEH